MPLYSWCRSIISTEMSNTSIIYQLNRWREISDKCPFLGMTNEFPRYNVRVGESRYKESDKTIKFRMQRDSVTILRWYGALNENGPHKLIGMTLLEVCFVGGNVSRDWAIEFQKSKPGPVLLSLPAVSSFRCRTLSSTPVSCLPACFHAPWGAHLHAFCFTDNGLHL